MEVQSQLVISYYGEISFDLSILTLRDGPRLVRVVNKVQSKCLNMCQLFYSLTARNVVSAYIHDNVLLHMHPHVGGTQHSWKAGQECRLKGYWDRVREIRTF